MKLLNIGLRRNGEGELSIGSIHATLAANDIHIVRWAEVEEGKSEPTYIGLVEGASRDRIERVAMELGQDAIAVYDLKAAKGELIGPKARGWGAFDRQLFQVL